MRRLHRGDDVRLGDPRQVGGVDQLDMLDPEAAVAGEGRAGTLISGNDHRIGGIADRVGRDLQAKLGGGGNLRVERRLVEPRQPA